MVIPSPLSKLMGRIGISNNDKPSFKHAENLRKIVHKFCKSTLLRYADGLLTSLNHFFYNIDEHSKPSPHERTSVKHTYRLQIIRVLLFCSGRCSTSM